MPNTQPLQQRLSPQAYACTQQDATEPPFRNAYWQHHEPGVYVDVVDATPLFLSSDKFDSGTGWPSFTRPASPDAVLEREDRTLGMVRREVRSKAANSHLGHVFDDGPAPGHRRYCINSASLRFVPASELSNEGLDAYAFALAPSLGWQVAVVGAGCFWGTQEMFETLPGVKAVQVGYAGGSSERVGYEEVCTGRTGHAEVARIAFDPKQTSYTDVLRFFFRMHDPTTPDRQKNDRGSQYRSVIFTTDATQQAQAQAVIQAATRSGHFDAAIVTQVAPLTTFVPAEPYHQHYLRKHPDGYRCHRVAPWDFAP